MTCGAPENIAKNLVFYDGITRCGKTLFNHILPSLKDFEHMQFYYLLELVVPALYLNKVTPDYAKGLVRVHMNELAYNIRLSRHVNFRKTDESGIANYVKPKLYYNRLKRKEGDDVVAELRNDKRRIPFQTHDLLVNLGDLNKLDIDYHMICLFRHPIDNCYSWFTRGFGVRFGVDPREFTLCIEHKKKTLPWYVSGYENEWLKLKPMEKCIMTALDLIRKSVRQYKKAHNKKRLHLVTFEDFVQRPEPEMKKICKFLNARETRLTRHFIHKARCPRVLDPRDRERKLSQFKKGAGKKAIKELLEMSQRYETNLYGLRK